MYASTLRLRFPADLAPQGNPALVSLLGAYSLGVGLGLLGPLYAAFA